ncbi:MAG: hypothetical protein WC119_05835 [Synergistaceae bacterium]
MKKEQTDLKHEEEFVAFLKKRFESENFKANVSAEKYEKTKRKYDKAKLKLKMMKQGIWK